MNIFVIATPFMDTGYFGAYSTLKRARLAFEKFLASDPNVVSFEDVDNYWYSITTINGEHFGAEILWDMVDAEFVKGIIKEDE